MKRLLTTVLADTVRGFNIDDDFELKLIQSTHSMRGMGYRLDVPGPWGESL